MVNVATCYSNLLIVFNCFRMTRPVNTALYLSSGIAFVVNVLLMLKNPKHLGVLLQDTAYLNSLPLAVQHVLNQLWHLLPLVIFWKRQKIKEVFSRQAFLISTVFFFAYVLFFPSKSFIDNYDFTKLQMSGLAAIVAGTLVLWTRFQGHS